MDRAGGAPERRGEGDPGGPFQAPPRAPRCEPLMMASFHSQTLPPWSKAPFPLGELVAVPTSVVFPTALPQFVEWAVVPAGLSQTTPRKPSANGSGL